MAALALHPCGARKAGGFRKCRISAWIFYFRAVWRPGAAGRPPWRDGRRTRNSKLRDRSKQDVVRRTIGGAAAVLLAAGLGACGTISEESAASAFIVPGKFQIYSCEDVDGRVTTFRKRQVELEQLMARASQGTGGEFINSVAYRTEYLQTRGELNELKKASADKQCAVNSKFSSGRAVF